MNGGSGDFCNQDMVSWISAIWYKKKGKSFAEWKQISVERNELSLFKRRIDAVQRYKKCYEIHNVPNKMCSGNPYF